MKDFILGFVIGFSTVAVYFYKDFVAAALLCGIYMAVWAMLYAVRKIGI